MHTVEVLIFVENPNEQAYDEITMEVNFHLDSDGDITIISHEIDNKEVELRSYKNANPSIEKRINWAIDDYLMNYEPDHMDCE